MTVFFVKPCKTYLYIEEKDINQVSPVILALGSSNIFSAFIFFIEAKKFGFLSMTITPTTPPSPGSRKT